MTTAIGTITPYFFSLILLVSTGGIIFLQKRKVQEQHKIKQLRRKIQAVVEMENASEHTAPFSATLVQAAITTRLQQPRLQLQTGCKAEPPEKYKFFSNMVAQGMGADEIAPILGISQAEAAQLARLSGLRGQGDSMQRTLTTNRQ